MFCNRCGLEDKGDSRVCMGCGQPLPVQGDKTGRIIPNKNPFALTAYYLWVFSLLPLIGFPLGIAAFIFGLLGLKKHKANPAIKGLVHAWIGIVGGGLTAIIWGAAWVGISHLLSP